ncbi:right-handed parallel beta-helix repeat-containing protein [Providencia stuartii]|uniref:tail fiber/spike domain-containing protein n=1 Tax=Providencia stuartii TaxID=588 RepID=UPI0024B1C539
MREVKPTQKPVPSSDIKDLFFNSGLLDIWATSLERKYIDRFGNCHLTAAGMEWIFNELVTKFKIESEQALLAAGYAPAGTFQEGAEVVSRNGTVLWKLPDGDGDHYRWDGDLPKQVPAGSTPQSTGGIGKGAWVSVGDASLRGDMRTLVYVCDNLTIENVPRLYTNVILKSRYNYKRAPSVYVVDGIRVIVSADGAAWEIHNPVAIYASDFCHDTDSLQKAYRIATQLNAKFYIDKTFENLLPTTKISGGMGGVHDSVLQILDDSYLEFINDGALKLANTNSPWSNILFCGMGVNNFQIINPVIHGDRLLNTENNQDPMKGQWGYGITVYDCSNGHIKNPKVYDCLGDGIYVGKRYGDTSDAVPTNVLIEYPVITGVRRNGISLCAGDSVNIIDPVISNVGDYDGVVGAWPKSGIDIEPEKASSEDGDVRLINSTITNPTIKRCYAGIYVNSFRKDLVMSLVISGNTTIDRVVTTGIGLFRSSGGTGRGSVHFDRVVFLTNPTNAIQFGWGADDDMTASISEIVDATSAVKDFNFQFSESGIYNVTSLGNFSLDKFTSKRNTLSIFDVISMSKYDIKQFFIDGGGRVKTSLSLTSGAPKSISGRIDGLNIATEFSYSRSQSSSIRTIPDLSSVLVDTARDYRELTISRALNKGASSPATVVSGIRIMADNGVILSQLSSTSVGAWIKVKNNPDPNGLTEILGSRGQWS